MDTFIEKHSGELMILSLLLIIVVTLIILAPQLMRAHLHKVEMAHDEHMKALENGHNLQPEDSGARFAGRTALLVPMVVMLGAGTVTCFLSVYLHESLFATVLAVWVVSGVVSLAAITGGVALIGRLAQLRTDESDEQIPPNPLA